MTATVMRAPAQPAPPPLSLYVHWPWCVRRCPYCDFNAHAAPAEVPESEYLDALRADLEFSLPRIWGRAVQTIYIGGGTPSLMSPAGLERMLSDVRMLLPLQPDAEITMEANPGTTDRKRFAAYAAAGITRISLGIQSLRDEQLRTLGRIHDAREALRAAEAAIATGLRVNLDLMTGLPGQSPADAADQAAQLAGLGAEHLSIYRLTLEPGTPFFRSPPAGMPAPDDAADAEDAAAAAAADAGYARYEVSAYARGSDAQSRHNLNYWRFGDYLGVGAGAHSKLTDPDGVRRAMRHKAPDRYLAQTAAGAPVADERRLGASDLAFEFMLNALRLTDGFDSALFAQRTGLAPGVLASGLAAARERGLAVEEGGRIRATARGLDLLNDLIALFAPDPAPARVLAQVHAA